MDSCGWHSGFCLCGDGCFSKVLVSSHLGDGRLAALEGRSGVYASLSVWLGEIFSFRGLEDVASKL